MAHSSIVESGGGSRGSHAAGIALYVGEHEHQRYGGFEFMWGTSVGSINTCGWAHEAPDDFPVAAQFVVDLWWKHMKRTKDIWRWRINFPLLKYAPALWSDSLGNTEPLRRLLTKVVDPFKVRTSGVQCRWPAVSLKTGKVVVFDQHHPEMIDCLLASSAFPAFFPLVEIPDSEGNSDWYSDGGLRDIAPLGNAIDAGADRILCILSRNPWVEQTHKRPKNVMSRAMLEIDIQSDEVLKNDVERCMRKNDLAELESNPYRHVELDIITPSRMLGDSLDFSRDLMRRQIELGYEDAQKYFANKRNGL